MFPNLITISKCATRVTKIVAQIDKNIFALLNSLELHKRSSLTGRAQPAWEQNTGSFRLTWVVQLWPASQAATTPY